MTGRRRLPPVAVARLGLSTVTILESLYQHRLLSTVQIHELHTPGASDRWTRKVLGRLLQVGLVAVTRAPGGLGLWYLTERGADAVETIPSRAEQRRKVILPEQAAGPLQAHTLAVNDVGLAFVRAARALGHECGPFAWRHEIAHPLSERRGHQPAERLIADALLTYQLHDDDGPSAYHYRLLELDRATIQVEHLSAKLARYARLYEFAPPDPARADDEPAPLWRRSYPVFPGVLVVLDGQLERAALERRRDDVLHLARADDELRATPEVEITVCLLEDLAARGPFAPICRTLADPDTPADWLGSTTGAHR
ncbi:MAG TPA: replication-relaxation family protein [Conexibacter sp.]|nr:replication-relaxation family protein [Conexibacter sp.]